MLGSSWVAAQLPASQEGLSPMSEWVSILKIGVISFSCTYNIYLMLSMLEFYRGFVMTALLPACVWYSKRKGRRKNFTLSSPYFSTRLRWVQSQAQDLKRIGKALIQKVLFCQWWGCDGTYHSNLWCSCGQWGYGGYPSLHSKLLSTGW
jgi:hypothetical protein